MNEAQEKKSIFNKVLDVVLQIIWFAVPATSISILIKSLGAPIWFSTGIAFIIFYLAAIVDKINELREKEKKEEE
jgi:hypothetical protein